MKKTPVYDYLPEQLNILAQYPQETQAKVRDAFRQMYFWMMQIDADAMKKQIDEQNQFQITLRRTGPVQFIALQGRLDNEAACWSDYTCFVVNNEESPKYD